MNRLSGKRYHASNLPFTIEAVADLNEDPNAKVRECQTNWLGLL